jgi:hypothetical protein
MQATVRRESPTPAAGAASWETTTFEHPVKDTINAANTVNAAGYPQRSELNTDLTISLAASAGFWRMARSFSPIIK